MFRKRTVVAGGAGVVLAVFVIVALTAGVSSGSNKKTVRIAFFNPIVANAFTASQYRGIKLSAKKANATVTQFDAGFDQNKQIRSMQDAIVSKKFDAFVITPVNGAVLVQPTQDAIAAGIKVVVIFNGIGPDLDSIKPQVKGISSVIGQRLSINGRLLGQWIAKACGSKNPCKAAYMPGSFKQGTEIIRLNALNKVLKGHPNIKKIQSAEGGYTAAPALKAATDVLTANSDLDVFATSGDQMMTGIIQAVKNAGLSGKIKLVGNGTTIEGVSWVRAGIVLADPVGVPYTEGVLGAKYAIMAVNGQAVPSSVNELAFSPVGPVATKATLSTKKGKNFKGQYHG
jgi:ribose transport system substrate-binding protein